MTLRTGHQALPTSIPRGAQLDAWWRRLADSSNEMLHGGLNNVLDVTLTANAASTTVTDNRIGSSSRISLTAMSANAAAALATTYYAVPTKHTLVLTHATNAQTDRSFSIQISG